MKRTWKKRIYIRIVVLFLTVGLLCGVIANRPARAGVGMLVVLTEENVVLGFHWTLGSELTVTVDNPETEKNPDYRETKIVEADPGEPTSTKVTFEPGEAITIQPGYFVTLTDGVDTREHTVTSLARGDGDVCNDTVWGTAAPSTEVYVQNFYDRGVQRWVPVDVSGNWLADFSVPGDEPGEEKIRDIGAYDRFMVIQFENTGHTQYDWIAPNPIVVIHPVANYAYGSGWPAGSQVTFAVDDPDTAGFPDYEETQTVVEDPNDPGWGSPVFLSGATFDIEVGHHAILTEACYVKEHTVINLTVQGGDIFNHTIWGTAEPDSRVWVVLGLDWSVVRWETVNGDGNWLADFSVPGDEPGEEKIYHFSQDTWLTAFQFDEDHDRTTIDWVPPAKQPVEIDIKPGSDPNCFNNNGHGVIPVAILTTDTFDAATVDPFSVSLDGAVARVKGKSGNAGSLEDVDNDGDLDLVVQIEDMDGTYQEGDTIATLTAETIDGFQVQGTDAICIVP